MTVCLTMFNKCNKCVLNQTTTTTNNKYNFLSSSSQKMFSIVLLDDSTMEICVDTKGTVGDLFQKVCDKLELKEFDIFGIAQKIKNEYHILPNDEKLTKLVSSAQKQKPEIKTSNNTSKKSINGINMNANILYNQSTKDGFNHISSPMMLMTSSSRLFSSTTTTGSSSISSPSSSSSYRPPPPPPLPPPPHHRAPQTQSPSCDLISYSSVAMSSKAYAQASLVNQISGGACSCSSVEPTITVYFVVKYYVTDPLVLREPKTRYLYYLQMRRNLIHMNHKMNDERYFVLASLALLVDYGAYDPTVHYGTYFNPHLYFPKWMIDKLGETFIYENMPALHERQSKQTVVNSLNKFCMELSSGGVDDDNDNAIDHRGGGGGGNDAAFNMHIYGVYKNKEETPGTICLGVAPKGILVFELRAPDEISLISTFAWSSVAKLNADKKKFEILINCDSAVRKYTYYTSNEKFSKYLLELSKSTHTFTSNIFARLANQKTLANYVSESYSEKVLAYSENRLGEPYEEREIRAKSSSSEKLSTIDSSTAVAVVAMVGNNTIATAAVTVTSDEDDVEKGDIILLEPSSSSYDCGGVGGGNNYDKSSSLSSLSMSTTTSSYDYSKLANGINLNAITISTTAAAAAAVAVAAVAVTSKSQSQPTKRGVDNSSQTSKIKEQSFVRTDSLSDYYEYNKKILLSDEVMTLTSEYNNNNNNKTSNSSSSSSNWGEREEQSFMNLCTKTSERKTLISCKVGGSDSCSSSSSSSPSSSSSYNNGRFIDCEQQHQRFHQFNSLPNMMMMNSVNDGQQTAAAATATASVKSKYLNDDIITTLIDTNSISGSGSTCTTTTTSLGGRMTSSVAVTAVMNDSTTSSSSSSSTATATPPNQYCSRQRDDEQSEPEYVNDAYACRFKSKLPPSYEESLRKMIKPNSISCDETNEKNDEDNLYENLDKVESKNDHNQYANHDYEINLSIENLEEIRAKAASMSLPLLTALCNDASLIRSLVKNSKNQASF